MAVCQGITKGADYNCQNPLKAGVNEQVLIGNLNDIALVTYDVVNTSVITNITMKSGKSMYSFQGVKASNKPQVDLVTDEVSVGFSHQLDVSIFEVDSEDKANLQGMAAVKQFAIYQNPKDSSLGDSVWEVLGVNAGLEMTTLTRLPATKDGSYKIQLKTPTTAGETGLPNSFWDTDIATTETNIEALLIPAP